MTSPQRLILQGKIEIDGDCVYVNGMILARVIDAAFPAEGAPKVLSTYGDFAIVVEKSQ